MGNWCWMYGLILIWTIGYDYQVRIVMRPKKHINPNVSHKDMKQIRIFEEAGGKNLSSVELLTTHRLAACDEVTRFKVETASFQGVIRIKCGKQLTYVSLFYCERAPTSTGSEMKSGGVTETQRGTGRQ